MKEVNYWLIVAAFSPLEARNGDLGIDPDDEGLMRRLFADIVAPVVRNWPEVWLDKLRLSLAYYMSRPEILQHNVLDTLQDLGEAKVTATKFDKTGGAG